MSKTILEDTQERTHLHVTNRDTVIPAITDNLILDFLPPLHTPLNKHLGARREGLGAQSAELLLVLRKARAQTTKRIHRAHNDRILNRNRCHDSLIRHRCCVALGTPLADLLYRRGEELPVLSGDDSLNGRAEHFDAEVLELVLQCNTNAEHGLPAKGDVDTVRLLELDDLAHELGGDGEEVHLIGETLEVAMVAMFGLIMMV